MSNIGENLVAQNRSIFYAIISDELQHQPAGIENVPTRSIFSLEVMIVKQVFPVKNL